MQAPLFKRDDIAYLITSASIGKLEGYPVSSVRSRGGLWEYRVDYDSRPPDQQPVGDRYDSRIPEVSVYHTEAELTTLCGAVGLALVSLNRQLSKTQALLSGCVPDEVRSSSDEPQFDVGDQVWFKAAAKIGFLDSAYVIEIDGAPAGAGARLRRFTYILDKKPKLFFYEDELTTYCDALNDAQASLQRQVISMKQKQVDLCPNQ